MVASLHSDARRRSPKASQALNGLSFQRLGPLSVLAARLAERDEVKGEVTLVVAPPGEGEVAAAAPEPAEALEAELRRRLAAGEPPSALAREVAKARGLKRSDVYDAIRRLRGE